MGIVRVVRVVCDGCGVGVLNTYASDAGCSSELVAACRECGSETARFYDVVLVERALAERYGLEHAA